MISDFKRNAWNIKGSACNQGIPISQNDTRKNRTRIARKLKKMVRARRGVSNLGSGQKKEWVMEESTSWGQMVSCWKLIEKNKTIQCQYSFLYPRKWSSNWEGFSKYGCRKLKPKIGREMIRKHKATQMSSSPQAQVNNILCYLGGFGGGG